MSVNYGPVEQLNAMLDLLDAYADDEDIQKASNSAVCRMLHEIGRDDVALKFRSLVNPNGCRRTCDRGSPMSGPCRF